MEGHQCRQLAAALHPPPSDALARPRHRPAGRLVRVRPDARRERVAHRRPGPGPRLAEDPRQGVRVPSRAFTGVNFWSAGTVGTLTASAPVNVQIRQRGDGTAVVSAASPSSGGTGSPPCSPRRPR
ncbi:polysaccharide lyase beta-sandwich domain-containing protein [Streptomyces wuyuanensis]|uniref:polysaccharide lyase beta-sandwich domain-containing protein n=1 Tax=Streptomyces wuyuanensis TaxID=1196353 RepID=UPI001FCD2324|nr:polysaccharide lyase beta-sandwich domain-containing protein [Streptomyces wuyuanensis]